jgi:hypothetical protein
MASDATNVERTMVLRQKCSIADLDSEKGSADRRSGDGTVRAAFRCPRGDAGIPSA